MQVPLKLLLEDVAVPHIPLPGGVLCFIGAFCRAPSHPKSQHCFRVTLGTLGLGLLDP